MLCAAGEPLRSPGYELEALVRHIISLNGNQWRLCAGSRGPVSIPADGAAAGGEWLPASVPGNVRADLFRQGRIPDPHVAPQESNWTDAHSWRYEVRFALDCSPPGRIHLAMEGVDYTSWTFLNGRRLSPGGGHEGMFSRQLYKVTADIAGENTLSVLIQGSDYIVDGHRRTWWERLLDRVEPGPSTQLSERFQTVKCQMGFGWDFAPRVRTMGLWDDVYLIRTGDVFLDNLWVRPRFDRGGVQLVVGLTVDARQAGEGRVCFALAGSNFDCAPQDRRFDVRWSEGAQDLSWTLPVDDPGLWWPWDHGYPHLYRLTAKLYDSGGTLSDQISQTVGLRDVSLAHNPGAPDSHRPWVFFINDEPVYVRGANWVPADILPGGVTTADYRSLLQMARDANMNAVRVWGGGLCEKRAFYDLCDEMGLLVWQEFPFACAFLTRYPRSGDYLDLVEAESRAIVHALRSHPSVVLWCAGNELHPGRHRALVSRLRSVVAKEDGTRPFSPASPHAGDEHNWNVWHGLAPVTDYATSSCQFASEYGLQAPPVVESLRAFVPPDQLWPPGAAWEEHCAQLRGLERYARPLLARRRSGARKQGATSLDTFVAASQRAQAIGLQIAIEHLRRRKYACSGTLVWQLNEPWPAISWSLIDHYRRPKSAYEVVRRAYNPTLVSLEYPIRQRADGELFAATVWVINDKNVDYPGCCVEVTLRDRDGEAVESWLHTLRVDADSLKIVGQVEWVLPDGGAWTATARLFHGEEVLCENTCDLAFFDSSRMSLLRWLYRWLTRAAVGS